MVDCIVGVDNRDVVLCLGDEEVLLLISSETSR